MDWWEAVVAWAEGWLSTQGFWTAIQGIGTIIAAAAALVALVIARSQLRQLAESNRLLTNSNDAMAESNKAMTESNIALTRPYVVVDFQYRPFLDRSGSVRSTNVVVHVENAGRTPAKNLRLLVDPPFPVRKDDQHPGWEESGLELNRVMNGQTVIKMLTPLRSLSFYFAEAMEGVGSDDEPPAAWTVRATYEDADGRTFNEEWTLELSHWRRALLAVDPNYRIAKGVQAIAFHLRKQKPPIVVLEPPRPPSSRRWRPAARSYSPLKSKD